MVEAVRRIVTLQAPPIPASAHLPVGMPFSPSPILVLDLIMPGVSGIEILRSLRENGYTGGIIIMTGSHNEELLEEAWALGPQEVLVKPIDLERLLTAIQLVLVCREC